MIYRVFGALYFGAADKLETLLQQTHTEPEVLILKMHEVVSMDASALHTLEHLYGKLRKHDTPYFEWSAYTAVLPDATSRIP
ncbi:MAG TPA: sodium-independent anion transporter [Aestuariivirga sp.]|nr:sodium-independent anion transporter [Aestuariivirga sp.]